MAEENTGNENVQYLAFESEVAELDKEWTSFIGSYDGSNTDAITGQKDIGTGVWATNNTAGGWNDCASNVTLFIARRI